jgi:uncharacterized protein (DUF58 family)
LRLAQHNDVLLLLTLDPMAREIPSTGELVASNGELQVEVAFGDQRVRKSLLEVSSRRIQSILNWQKELGTPVLVLQTSEDTPAQLRRLLGQAAAARSRV